MWGGKQARGWLCRVGSSYLYVGPRDQTRCQTSTSTCEPSGCLSLTCQSVPASHGSLALCPAFCHLRLVCFSPSSCNFTAMCGCRGRASFLVFLLLNFYSGKLPCVCCNSLLHFFVGHSLFSYFIICQISTSPSQVWCWFLFFNIPNILFYSWLSLLVSICAG